MMYQNEFMNVSQETLREGPEYNFQLKQNNADMNEGSRHDYELNNDLTGKTLEDDGMLMDEILSFQQGAIKAMGNITRRLSISEYHNNQPLYFEYEFFNRETNMNNDSGNTTFSDYEMDEDMNCDTTFTQNEGSGVKMESSMSLLLSGLDQDIAMNLDADRQQQQETGGMKKLFKLNKMFRISSRDLIDEPQQIFKKKYFWSRKPTVPILKNSGDSFSEDEDVMTDVETRITTALVNPSKLLAKTPIDAHSMELSSSSTKLSSLEPELLLSSNSSMLSSTNTNNSVELKSKLHFNPHSDLNSNFNSAIVKKQQGMPKTRGRKPSPLLDASKQFGCDYCERRFKRQEHLKRHVRSLHMCEKPYECSICGKKFSRSDNLNQHLKTHGNDQK